jgi:hypothetical protein
MPLNYPTSRHARRHGPFGYTAYQSFKPWLRDEFSFRCVYCLVPERWYPNRHGAYGVEHFVPKHQEPTLECDYDNLLYACNRCNSERSEGIVLDPCATGLGVHLSIDETGWVHALTEQGAIHINNLRLNDLRMVDFRREWLVISAALRSGKVKPQLAAALRARMSLPEDIPDLSLLRAPGNTRPEGIANSFYALRRAGTLPLDYFDD